MDTVVLFFALREILAGTQSGPAMRDRTFGDPDILVVYFSDQT